MPLKGEFTTEKWKPRNCPCRLCKNCVQNYGFIW